jgi:F1F0 ATPase subunit 2
MFDTVSLSIYFGVGAALGAVHFTGLWMTVRRLPAAKHPLIFLYGGFLARTALLMTGFTLLTDGRGESLATALLGFLLAREVLVRRFGMHS